MNSPLISVIVPIYNAENCLERSIESLTNQTYGNIEIILVNDGSKDNSLKLCNELANKDKRINIIIVNLGTMISIIREEILMN